MKIFKSEMPYAIRMIMQNHNCNAKEAVRIIDHMNGEMKEISKKIRQRREDERKRKSKDFSNEFRKMKSGN